MIIHRVFDEVFRSWSHVAVLRALLDTTTGLSGNETARVAGMHPRSALKALSSLEILGIVCRQRGGRDHIFTLNRNHALVRDAIIPMYEEERKFRERIFSVIVHVVKKYVVSAVIFGSVARKEESAGSDLDLCCIVSIAKDKDAVREKLNVASKDWNKTFGIKIAPVILTTYELKKKSRTQLVKDLINDGIVIAGKSPKVILHG